MISLLLSLFRESALGAKRRVASSVRSPRPLRVLHRQIAALVSRFPCAQSGALERMRLGATPRCRRNVGHPARTPGALHLDAGRFPLSSMTLAALGIVGSEHPLWSTPDPGAARIQRVCPAVVLVRCAVGLHAVGLGDPQHRFPARCLF